MDPKRMKVAELRKELKKRQIISTGTKADLVARLKACLLLDEVRAPDDHCLRLRVFCVIFNDWAPTISAVKHLNESKNGERSCGRKLVITRSPQVLKFLLNLQESKNGEPCRRRPEELVRFDGLHSRAEHNWRKTWNLRAGSRGMLLRHQKCSTIHEI
ncbi:hypothetical protein GE061_002390 [Apolygus lucorum]|uniref:SAP domain-containing protein n=1 Tax=Apolygus lucorum TaxID=248454 RepID=A0A8S9X4M3_APOLU|nr:hypothetical protein GE061_002390 [Apolygus lucorum]